LVFEKGIIATVAIALLGLAVVLLEGAAENVENIPYAVLVAVVGFLLIWGYTYLVEKQAVEKAVEQMQKQSKRKKRK